MDTDMIFCALAGPALLAWALLECILAGKGRR